VAPEVNQEVVLQAPGRTRFSVANNSFLAGNFRAVVFALLFGALAFVMIGIVWGRHRSEARTESGARQLVPATTLSLSSAQHPEAAPAPITVQIRADLIRVTAISLGHPRLAIINGHQVAEGEMVTLHTPTASVAVTLKVVKIGDGRIDLSDGTQIITARLDLSNDRDRR